MTDELEKMEKGLLKASKAMRGQASDKALDAQVGGGHYKHYKIQPIEFVYHNNIPAIEANIIKYTMRHRDKNGKQDLRKAAHLIQILMDLEYGEE